MQGAAGMRIADPAAVEALGAACARHDVLLICDEVATGFGRTGTLFASEQCGLRPDLLVIGKGLTAGYLPKSATVASGRVFDAFLGPDLSDGPCTTAIPTAGTRWRAPSRSASSRCSMRDDVLANVRARSAELRDRSTTHRAAPAVRDVRLRGLMGGVELAAPDPAQRWGRRVCAAAVERGVLVRPLGDVVVVMPPLTITTPELDRIVDVLAAAIEVGCR